MANVLVACEYSGVVRDAFTRAGHFALSCDLLPSEAPGEHYQGDLFDAAKLRRWDLLVAHPPCTYLSSSGIHWNARRPERAELTTQAVEFVKRIWALDIPRRCIENPVGVLSTRWRRWSQIIHPYQFGHDASKATCLWLNGLPALRPTNVIAGRWSCCGERLPDGVGKYGCPNCNGECRPRQVWGNQTANGQNRLPPSADRWKERSRTYVGVADAMAEQWGALL